MASIDQYEFIEAPGTNNVRIPIIKRTSEHEQNSSGTRIPDWVVCIEGITESFLTAPNSFDDCTELFGFYCESAAFMKGDSANNFYPSATIWHSDIFIVTQNGKHTPTIRNYINSGAITQEVSIVRLSRIGEEIEPIQVLTFETCHWCGIQSHLDWTIARFTACTRTNTTIGVRQDGLKLGKNAWVTHYANNDGKIEQGV